MNVGQIRLVCLLLCLLPCLAGADQDSEEYRLLKSWGLQFNAQGRLLFRPQEGRAASETPPWQPDISGYRSTATVPASEPLVPLVITSKQAPAQ